MLLHFSVSARNECARLITACYGSSNGYSGQVASSLRAVATCSVRLYGYLALPIRKGSGGCFSASMSGIVFSRVSVCAFLGEG